MLVEIYAESRLSHALWLRMGHREVTVRIRQGARSYGSYGPRRHILRRRIGNCIRWRATHRSGWRHRKRPDVGSPRDDGRERGVFVDRPGGLRLDDCRRSQGLLQHIARRRCTIGGRCNRARPGVAER